MALLEGKTVIVSGVGTGLGRDLARQMASHGASVVLGARRAAFLEEVADELRASGARVTWQPTDITDPAQCAALAQRAVDEFGRIDVLVNNAFDPGMSAGSPYAHEQTGELAEWHTFIDADVAVWRKAMDVNLFGTLEMTRAVVPAMRAQGDGRVIMINTQSSMWIKPTHGAYATSKGALAIATKTLARELGPFGIRVNGIHPGFIDGEPVAKSLGDASTRSGVSVDAMRAAIAKETCLKYLPSGEEISGAAVFLASDLAKPITGQALAVNAGHWIGD